MSPRLLGVTGAVVCALLRERGFAILDVDDVAAAALHELQPQVAALLREHAPEALPPPGEPLEKQRVLESLLHRQQLRREIESLLLPRVLRHVTDWAAMLVGPGALEAALLLESGLSRLCSETLALRCPVAERRRRVLARSTTSAGQFDAIEAAQWSEEVKAAQADGVLETAGPLAQLPALLDVALSLCARRALERRFCNRWRELGSTHPGLPRLFADLLHRYQEPARAFHTLSHVQHCLDELDRLRPPAADGAILELALWYHDAVYDSQASDNEERSAQLAREAARSLGLPMQLGERLAALVLTTKTHGPVADPLAQLLIDLDLSILGAEPDRFAEYERGIRFEYQWVLEELYREKRAEVLRRFLGRNPLFHTQQLRERLEAQARRNLAASIAAAGPDAGARDLRDHA